MEKAEVRLLLMEQVVAYEKMMDDNMDKMAHFQERIADLKAVNQSYLGKIREIQTKLNEIK